MYRILVDIAIIFSSILNVIGIALWGFVSLIMMEVLLCRHAKDMEFSSIVRSVFSRKMCLTLRKIRRRYKQGFINGLHISSILFFVASYIVIYYRLTELTEHVRGLSDYLRTLSSVILPAGIIVLYRFMGYKVSIV